jgi:hypothetical protein
MKAEVIVEVNGKEVYRGPSKSFVVNIAKLLLGAFSSSGGYAPNDVGLKNTTTVTAPDGSNKTVWEEWYCDVNKDYGGGVQSAMGSPDNDDSYGIWVGTGSTPVSPNDYKLVSKIPHGTGSGQMDYESHTVISSYSDTYSYFETSRSFINRSGADVIVREIGLAARSYWKDESTVRNDIKFLMARDVLPTPITVKNLGNLTVRYRVSLVLT